MESNLSSDSVNPGLEGRMPMKYVIAMLLCAMFSACGGLKYAALNRTSVENPPKSRVKVYLKQLPVSSKAAIVVAQASVGSGEYQSGGRSTNELANQGRALIEISRPSRIEDLSGSVLRELRKDEIRTLVVGDEAITEIKDVQIVENPYLLVSPEDPEAQLEISGNILIKSERVKKKFTLKTSSVVLELSIKDLATGKVVPMLPFSISLNMIFNSRELEEAITLAVVTSLTQKVLF